MWSNHRPQRMEPTIPATTSVRPIRPAFSSWFWGDKGTWGQRSPAAESHGFSVWKATPSCLSHLSWKRFKVTPARTSPHCVCVCACVCLHRQACVKAADEVRQAAPVQSGGSLFFAPLPTVFAKLHTQQTVACVHTHTHIDPHTHARTHSHPPPSLF